MALSGRLPPYIPSDRAARLLCACCARLMRSMSLPASREIRRLPSRAGSSVGTRLRLRERRRRCGVAAGGERVCQSLQRRRIVGSVGGVAASSSSSSAAAEEMRSSKKSETSPCQRWTGGQDVGVGWGRRPRGWGHSGMIGAMVLARKRVSSDKLYIYGRSDFVVQTRSVIAIP